MDRSTLAKSPYVNSGFSGYVVSKKTKPPTRPSKAHALTASGPDL